MDLVATTGVAAVWIVAPRFTIDKKSAVLEVAHLRHIKQSLFIHKTSRFINCANSSRPDSVENV